MYREMVVISFSCAREKANNYVFKARRLIMLKWFTLRITCGALLLSGIVSPEAHAYIDPGSGSVLLQLILGGIAGIGVVAKLYWGRAKERYRSLFAKSSHE
jgi:hypothetical protein